jgi:hypothetical protein
VLNVDGIAFKNTLRVPGLGADLISENAMQMDGCNIVSRDDWRRVYQGGRIIVSAKLERGLFLWRPTEYTWRGDEVGKAGLGKCGEK